MFPIHKGILVLALVLMCSCGLGKESFYHLNMIKLDFSVQNQFDMTDFQSL